MNAAGVVRLLGWPVASRRAIAWNKEMVRCRPLEARMLTGELAIVITAAREPALLAMAGLALTCLRLRTRSLGKNFDHPHAVGPRPFAGSAAGGRLRFELPIKSIAVVQVR